MSDTLCEVPGARTRVDGLGVTPEGKPLSETFTLAVKPFNGFAVTFTDDAAPPAVRERLVGKSVREKSGVLTGADTVSATVARRVMLPEVPVNVTVEFPAVAFAAAVKVTVCATPGVKVSPAGLAVTPVGNPLMVTLMDPTVPLSAAAVTVTDCAADPAVTPSVEGVAVNVKLGPRLLVTVFELWLPQPETSNTSPAVRAAKNTEIVRIKGPVHVAAIHRSARLPS